MDCTYLKIHNLIRFDIYMYISIKIISKIKTTSLPYPSCPKISLYPPSCPFPPSSQATTDLISFAIKLLAFSNFFLRESFNKYSIVHSIILVSVICHNCFIHSPVDGHLDYFQFCTVTNKTAMNIYVQVFVRTRVFISVG